MCKCVCVGGFVGGHKGTRLVCGQGLCLLAFAPLNKAPLRTVRPKRKGGLLRSATTAAARVLARADRCVCGIGSIDPSTPPKTKGARSAHTAFRKTNEQKQTTNNTLHMKWCMLGVIIGEGTNEPAGTLGAVQGREGRCSPIVGRTDI